MTSPSRATTWVDAALTHRRGRVLSLDALLLAVIVIVTLLQYLPALVLGPVAEQALSARGATF